MAIAKRKRIENYIILGAFAALTLFIAVFALITVLPVFTIDSYSDIKEITYDEMLKKGKNEKEGYYVFFANEDNADSNELETAVSEFAEFLRTNAGERIYIIYTNKRENSGSTYKAPTLLYISNGTVKETYKTYSNILNHFNDKINK